QQNDQRPVAGLDVMQPAVADLGVALPNFGPAVRHKPGQPIGRAHEISSRDCAWVRTRLVLSLERRARVCPGLLPGVSRAPDARSTALSQWTAMKGGPPR